MGGTLFVHATPKNLDYLRDAAAASAGGPLKVVLLPREKGDAAVPANRAALDALLSAVAAAGMYAAAAAKAEAQLARRDAVGAPATHARRGGSVTGQAAAAAGESPESDSAEGA